LTNELKIELTLENFCQPVCLPADMSTCRECAAIFASELAMGMDATCRLCSPRDERLGAGCGGVGLTQEDVLNSNLLSVCGTILIRFVIGPVTEQLGPRLTYTYLLLCMSLPGFFAAGVWNAGSFLVARLFISFAGGAFVVTQIWTALMFDSKVIGLASATTAGWGNIGGGVTQLATGAIFSALLSSGFTNDSAWRASLVVPPILLLLVALIVVFASDDSPLGRKPSNPPASKTRPNPATSSAFLKMQWLAASNWRTWVLFICYNFTFGVELVINGNMALYLSREFSLDQSTAGVCASIFGMCNLFARSLGGFVSDRVSSRFGLLGRLITLWILEAGLGVSLVAFSFCSAAAPGLGLSVV
jgi:NNP family nitrate/nitrite transporter-like MFS transporter